MTEQSAPAGSRRALARDVSVHRIARELRALSIGTLLIGLMGCKSDTPNPPSSTEPVVTATQILLDTTQVRLAPGESRNIGVRILSSTGSSLSQSVQWASTVPSVASVAGGASAGLINALAPGQATITATTASGSSSISASLSVTVQSVSPANVSITLDSAQLTMNPGDTRRVVANVRNSLGQLTNAPITFISGNVNVATVAAQGLAGAVTAIAPGQTTLTAQTDGANGLLSVTIPMQVRSSTPTVAVVSVSPNDVTLPLNASTTLVASALSATGGTVTGRPVQWRSSLPSVINVDSVGRITAVSASTALVTITATIDNVSGIAVARVQQSAPVATTISFGTSSTRVLVLESGGSATPVTIVRDASGQTIAGAPVSYTARTGGLVTVNSNGSITAGSTAGQSIVVAQASGVPGVADSLLVVIAPAGGHTARVALERFDVSSGSTLTLPVVVDLRSSAKKLGAGTVRIVWDAALVDYVGHANDFGSMVVNESGAATGSLTLSFASGGGQSGAVTLTTLTWRARSASSVAGRLTVTATELFATDFSNLLSATVFVSHPFVVR